MYIKPLDGMRGVAILLVAAIHGMLIPWFGWVGVQMFFVLSGFLITRILLEERHRPRREFLRRFYTRRALRIFPLYFSYLALLWICFSATGVPEYFGRYRFTLLTYTYNFFQGQDYSPSFSPIWSLCVEEQIYLVWPWIVYALSPRTLVRVLLILIIGAPLFRWFASIHEATRLASLQDVALALGVRTPSQVDAFAVGAGVAVLRLERRIAHPVRLFVGLSLVVLSVGVLNLWFLAQANRVEGHWSSLGYPLGMAYHWQFIWGYSLLNFFFAALLLCLLQSKNRLSLFEWWPLVAVGRISYGMYLLHGPILFVFLGLSGGWQERLLASGHLSPSVWVQASLGVLRFGFGLALVYGAATLSYRYLEAPFLRLKDVLAPREAGMSIPSASPQTKPT